MAFVRKAIFAMEPTGARSPEIVRCKAAEIGFGSKFFDHAPDHFLRDAVAPDRARAVHASQEPTVGDLRRRPPTINRCFDPAGNWNGSDMAAFAVKIENDPSFIALLESLNLQFGYFGAA